MSIWEAVPCRGGCCFGWRGHVSPFKAAPGGRKHGVAAFLKLRIHRDGCFFAETPLAPEKNTVYSSTILIWLMKPIPLKTMAWSLEFNQQPSTKPSAFAASLREIVVRMDRVLPCTLRPNRCSSSFTVRVICSEWDTESWCVCCVAE